MNLHTSTDQLQWLVDNGLALEVCIHFYNPKLSLPNPDACSNSIIDTFVWSLTKQGISRWHLLENTLVEATGNLHRFSIDDVKPLFDDYCKLHHIELLV